MAIALPATLGRRRLGRCGIAALIVAVWVIGYSALRGRNTLYLAPSDTNRLQTWLNSWQDSVGNARGSNPVFLYGLNPIRSAISALAGGLQALLSQPALGRPVPIIGWVGVIALLAYGSWLLANLKVALLLAAGFVFIGLQGLWQPSMDTLALTIAAVVISLLIGIPLGVLAGVSNRVNVVLTPVLDLMQTMPSFVYLAPLTLIFLIGNAAATIATLIYAVPPVIRLTAHGIRSVPSETREAAESLGCTPRQRLRDVLLPLATKTIVVGINQTIMAALSMVTIAALIGAPGLGQVVVQALESLDVGTAFNAGLAIVVMAIVLDRVTTAAAAQVGRAAADRPPRQRLLHRGVLAAGAVLTVVAIYLSTTYLWASEFPTGVDLGTPLQNGANAVSTFAQNHLTFVTGSIKNGVTSYGIDPLQSLLDQSPWWLVVAALLALALLLGGVGVTVGSAVCLALLLGTGLWSDAMDTLASTLIATVIVMIVSIALGAWIGRSDAADRVIRPLLDAGQTMPSFVYLVPFIALFAAGRFTGVIAAVVYAVPVATKIIADGVRAVSPTTVEAATSAGSTGWQVVTKVQLPMAARSVALAANQGLIYVLAMVVVSGLVGAGALGYDVVAGFVQTAVFGKGLAAGVAIVLLGVLLDRITQGAARRAGPQAGR